jgi:hypothetical protein
MRGAHPDGWIENLRSVVASGSGQQCHPSVVIYLHRRSISQDPTQPSQSDTEEDQGQNCGDDHYDSPESSTIHPWDGDYLKSPRNS